MYSRAGKVKPSTKRGATGIEPGGPMLAEQRLMQEHSVEPEPGYLQYETERMKPKQ